MDGLDRARLASHAATTVGAASSASAAMHAPAAAHLHLDERVLLDYPAREHRLTLEPLAAVVQLEGVSRQPRAFADVLVQGTSGLLTLRTGGASRGWKSWLGLRVLGTPGAPAAETLAYPGWPNRGEACRRPPASEDRLIRGVRTHTLCTATDST
eukprot:scaffold3118_cov64-Phaeocystis_antarctica.AAC.3